MKLYEVIKIINFKELRTNTGHSQKEVAKYLGITQQAYANYERGARQADYTSLIKLADYFGCSVDYLLGRSALSAPPSETSPEELYLINTFRELNQEGQKYILDTLELVKEKYKKDNTVSKMDA